LDRQRIERARYRIAGRGVALRRALAMQLLHEFAAARTQRLERVLARVSSGIATPRAANTALAASTASSDAAKPA